MNPFNLYAKRSLTQIEGALTLHGLRSAVEVIRDRWGVPHIYAESIEDALFAQGFVHAQDRLWQMDVNRRAGQGRLSEIFGRQTLDLDRFARTAGWARAAQAEIDAADPESLALLDAFVAGVNAWIEHGPRPVEHRLLRLKVEPWTRLDSAAWGILLAWGLSWNWESELERLALWKRLGPEAAAEMESDYPESQATILAAASGLEDVCAHLLEAYRRLGAWLQSPSEGVGSNSWVLSARRTVTGRPMLANDPHLRLSLPSIWYENHLLVAPHPPAPSPKVKPQVKPRTSGEEERVRPLNVTGVTLPGMPGVIFGHNDRIAWGLTATMADTQDLYLERFDPNDPARYQTPDGWAQAQMIRESIRVRFRRQPIEHVVRLTRHGPIVDDFGGRWNADREARKPRSAPIGSKNLRESAQSASNASEAIHLALKWTAHQPGNWLRSILALNRADDWRSFKDALRDWHAPVVNFVYADVEGCVAYRVAGRIPIRKHGRGLTPVAGWNDDHEWIGEIPFEELPEMLDADTLVTANNRVAGPGYPYFISHEWLNGKRAARIQQRLDQRERVSIENSLSIQLDVTSLDAPEIVGPLLQLEARTGREAAALERLRVWDGALAAGSVAASIYEVTQIELVRLLFAERLGPAFDGYIGGGQTALFVNVIFSNIALRQAREMLRRFTPQHDRLRAALNAALDKLTARFGSDMQTWQWGRLHRIEPAHTLSQIKPLRRIFNRGSFPIGGDGDTPQQANFRPTWPIESVSVAPSYRVVYDVGDWDRSVAVLPGGQSGHPASPHYFDQFPLWLAGKARPMLWSHEAVAREAQSRLGLRPK